MNPRSSRSRAALVPAVIAVLISLRAATVAAVPSPCTLNPLTMACTDLHACEVPAPVPSGGTVSGHCATVNFQCVCLAEQGSMATPTSTGTPTPTMTPTPVATATATPTPGSTGARTRSPSPTPTVIATASPSPTPEATLSRQARRCGATIAAASEALFTAELKAEKTCAAKIVAGKLSLGTSCATDPSRARAIAKARTKIIDAITKACGGRDKTCGSGGDDVPLTAIGWNLDACPSFAGVTCAGAIESCADVASCLTCVDEAVVAQAIALSYGALVPTEPKTEQRLNGCQATLGGSAAALLSGDVRTLAACWHDVGAEKASGVCPAAEGDAVNAIGKAEAKTAAATCKACGGADKACGGDDDLAPTDIGGVATCPDLHLEGGTSCAGAVATLPELVGCLSCVARFEADCAVRAAVPALVGYPTACE